MLLAKWETVTRDASALVGLSQLSRQKNVLATEKC